MSGSDAGGKSPGPLPTGPRAGYLSLASHVSLRRLEEPFLYDRRQDELYELNEDAMRFLERINGVTPGLAAVADPEFLAYLLDEGLAVLADRPGLRAPRRGGQPPPSLRYLELYLTERCNLACGHCFLGERTGRRSESPGHPRDLPAAAARRVMDEFDAMGGLRLLLTGGEALLHPDFWELNERLPAYGFRSVLLSNGWLLARSAPRLRVQEVQVSLDGLEPAHDALRGRGSFVRALAGLDAAREVGLDISVATMVHAADVGDFPAMAALVRQLGVRAWHVDVPSECGTLTGRADLLLPPAEAAPFLDYAFGGGTHDAIAGAVCGSHLMAVMPDGTAAKCGFFADRPVGAVESGLAELWRRVPRGRAVDLACACDHVAECHGGCRYRASTYNGEESPDPVQCARYGV